MKKLFPILMVLFFTATPFVFATTLPTENWANLDAWTTVSGSPYVSGNKLYTPWPSQVELASPVNISGATFPVTIEYQGVEFQPANGSNISYLMVSRASGDPLWIRANSDNTLQFRGCSDIDAGTMSLPSGSHNYKVVFKSDYSTEFYIDNSLVYSDSTVCVASGWSNVVALMGYVGGAGQGGFVVTDSGSSPSIGGGITGVSGVSGAMGGMVWGIILLIINLVLLFFNSILGLIVVTSLCVGLVWYFLRKTDGGGGHGRFFGRLNGSNNIWYSSKDGHTYKYNLKTKKRTAA